ncbi:hypothetical protein RCL_jg14563.t1 [Rhizophagus clarus]|uniref:Uncharacterized protein n=1 Tax=Rhizophagus clarus TaxID=94130 RepID=A0A8H3M0H3_9GLOM|nr:hypothetical protein RCL_jg14563.t1 [Rhizophagus clarus]
MNTRTESICRIDNILQRLSYLAVIPRFGSIGLRGKVENTERVNEIKPRNARINIITSDIFEGYGCSNKNSLIIKARNRKESK